jgi:transposase-like protein
MESTMNHNNSRKRYTTELKAQAVEMAVLREKFLPLLQHSRSMKPT